MSEESWATSSNEEADYAVRSLSAEAKATKAFLSHHIIIRELEEMRVAGELHAIQYAMQPHTQRAVVGAAHCAWDDLSKRLSAHGAYDPAGLYLRLQKEPNSAFAESAVLALQALNLNFEHLPLIGTIIRQPIQGSINDLPHSETEMDFRLDLLMPGHRIGANTWFSTTYSKEKRTPTPKLSFLASILTK